MSQVREAFYAICPRCHRERLIDFYSNCFCLACHPGCPSCSAPDSLKTYAYISLGKQKECCGVRCQSCNASWDSRAELDAVLLGRLRAEPAVICRVCGQDAYPPPDSVWHTAGGRRPHLCQHCQACPVCGGVSFESGGEGVKCLTCRTAFNSTEDFERRLLKKRQLI